MFRVALSVTAPNWKPSICPPTGEDKHTGVHAKHGTFFSHKKEHSMETHNADEPQRHFTEPKKPDTKKHILGDT